MSVRDAMGRMTNRWRFGRNLQQLVGGAALGGGLTSAAFVRVSENLKFLLFYVAS